jgi:hypothetical protein
MGDVESQLFSPESPECDALICVIQLLFSRTHQSLPLADLGALLPERHHRFIQSNGRLRGWILQFPIFSVTGRFDRQHVTLNFDSKFSEWSHGNEGKDQVVANPQSRRTTISEEEVVMAEDLLDNLLEHVGDLIDEISRLRRQLDAQNSLQTKISLDFAVKRLAFD